MRHTATLPLVLDLIRLIQSEAEKVDCFRIITFHLLSYCRLFHTVGPQTEKLRSP